VAAVNGSREVIYGLPGFTGLPGLVAAVELDAVGEAVAVGVADFVGLVGFAPAFTLTVSVPMVRDCPAALGPVNFTIVLA